MRTFALLLSLLVISSPALAEEAPDFSGVWKRDCAKSYGLKIWRNEDDQFSVTFCVVTSCGSPAFIPHTPIAGDPKFRIVSESEIGLRRVDVPDAFLMYHRCSRDPASPFQVMAAEGAKEASSTPSPK
ncbi:hypothetical protein [Bradyrhizobium sp. BR 10289]|uniref:hypothetical protein n=1 Tax=Bradyrhizobium sp. BR 10289 TaxID=2749993 RepID=UPI001C651567|nr:hypothetical protein [Bradyrhizobium sp. BR 10289]MBW7970040.1 hypothetical protein [Bradyrhizobium sp. BR 10289]